MFWHRFHRGDESFFNPPRCATTQQATGHCKRKEDLNTLLFRARRYKRSPFDQTLRCSPPVARRRHNRSMFESDTHEADEADEATETDESRYAPVVSSLVTAWYHRRHAVHGVRTSNIDETTTDVATDGENIFSGGFSSPARKNSFFVLNPPKASIAPTRGRQFKQTTRRRLSNQTNKTNFRQTTTTTTTTTVTSMYTIHTARQRKKIRCHQPGDSVSSEVAAQ